MKKSILITIIVIAVIVVIAPVIIGIIIGAQGINSMKQLNEDGVENLAKVTASELRNPPTKENPVTIDSIKIKIGSSTTTPVGIYTSQKCEKVYLNNINCVNSKGTQEQFDFEYVAPSMKAEEISGITTTIRASDDAQAGMYSCSIEVMCDDQLISKENTFLSVSA